MGTQGRHELLAEAEHWLSQDPDESSRDLLSSQISASRGGNRHMIDTLADEFSVPLAFGTAGLRGALGPGPNRMNRVVVSWAAAGVASWLIGHGRGDGLVLIGHDARHGSRRFARDSAEIMAGAGLDVLLFDRPVPTPVVAFGVRRLGAAAGIVVTASHNPASDNGYKVYDASGSQIITPSDAEISACIEQAAARRPDDLPRSEGYRPAGEDLLEDYMARAASLVGGRDPRDVRWVHTAMHGVGAAVLCRVARMAGLPAPLEVPEQRDPDPGFPTLPFPNPEEPGAMDLAMALAERQQADLAVATDPDADRCAVAVPGPGGWHRLTGNELGSLLADDAVRRGQPGVLARSVVSGSQIDSIARAGGRELVVTPTGFKWIGRVPRLGFGYEEALGYCCDPGQVGDKDGITAAVVVLRLVAELRAEGQRLGDRLDEIDLAHGVHETSQLAWRVADRSSIVDAMARLRACPPTELAGSPVGTRDLLPGVDGLPPIDVLEFARPGMRVSVRPSGTEAKLKCYLELIARPTGRTDLVACRSRARTAMDALRREVAETVGLGTPV